MNLKEKVIGSDLVADFRATIISSHIESDAGSLTKAFISSLSSIESFNVKVDVTGTIDDYALRVSSSLDRVLKNAIGEEVKKQSARLKKELKTVIDKEVKGPMRDLTKDIEELDGISSELTERFQQGNGLLK